MMAKFKTRARAVDMLGRQQIAGVPNAISELFKNAHDAYADFVEVDYFLSDGLFVLRDDGIGMSKEEFEERWLTLGTESKLGASTGMKPPPKDPEKPERIISGEKGIGRLAIAAIGPQVLVLTRAGRGKKQNDLVAAFIHWGLFEIPGINLDEIEIPIRSFPDGALPTRQDIMEMVEIIRDNLTLLETHAKPNIVQKILSDLNQFDFNLKEIARFLEGPNNRLSLEGNGRGTHFYILPAVDTLEEDVRQDVKSGEEISYLRRMLMGFTDTMTPNSSPNIRSAFRFWPTDDHYENILEESEFWTPENLERADHRFVGRFDEYGNFHGKVRIYDQKPIEYELPWTKSQGKLIECGPFSVDIGHIQGRQRESRLPPGEFADLNRKLKRIGGVYVYRDGIRMLPYGDVDYDWLEIEKRRTLKASYYFFSYRRMFGAIQISRKENHNLQEKAGREGFQQNKAYRQFRDILMNFLVQLVAEFFRAGAPREPLYKRRKEEIKRREAAKEEAEERGKKTRRRFERALDSAFARINDAEPNKKVSDLLEKAENSLQNAIQHGGQDLLGNNLILGEEVKFSRKLDEIRHSYRLERPEGVGLSQDLGRDWLVYSEELDRLEKEVFTPTENKLKEMVVEAAQQASIELDRRERIKTLLESAVSFSENLITETANETEQELKDVQSRVLKLTHQVVEDTQNIIQRIENHLNELEIEKMSPDEIESVRLKWERKIEKVTQKNKAILDHVRAQLKEVDWSLVDGHLIGTAEMRAAMEEELLALRDKAETYLELSQLGMAIEIIDHEFNKTIRTIRSSIYDLKDWADANPKLQPLYRNIRNNFEHLDGYLNLFTPLHRRLYRQSIEIKGADIANFLSELFKERLRENDIELIASSSFKDSVIQGYPSTFYPVFVNLIDNSIFWVKNRSEPREIHLDADENGFVIWDTGPGIPIRDQDAVFEMGFTRKPGGRGLGLYIAREVLKREDFRLELDRPVEEHGATFRIIPMNKSEG